MDIVMGVVTHFLLKLHANVPMRFSIEARDKTRFQLAKACLVEAASQQP